MIKSKKFLLRLVVLSIFVFGITSCVDKAEKEKERAPVPAPEQIVKIDEAKEMYNRYADRRVPLIQRYEDSINRSGIDDKMQQRQKNQEQNKADEGPAKFDVARYVYYDYKTIQNYMKFIEQQAEAANVDISTLRFYFSNYSEDDKNIHPRQNSIMISPALKKDNREYIFYIDDSDPQNPKPVLLGDNFGPVKSGMGATTTEENKAYASFAPSLSKTNSAVVLPANGRQSLTMNRGTGVPPPYHEE
ncbi:MAG: hypothetical protein GY931_08330 [Maribacter sp.]|nr:hypothetical protein [Maribacter sp.]